MILSLHRVGWRMTGPFTVVDDKGEEVAFTRIPPAMVSVMLRDATHRMAERVVGERMAQRDPAFGGRRVCFDHVVSQLKTDKRIDAHGRAAYLSVLCGAVMTYHRAANSGYMVVDKCPLCGADGDTIMHRTWKCSHPAVKAARDAVAPAWLQAEVERGAVSRGIATTGLVPHPGDVWPAPAATAAVEIDFGQGEGCERDDSDFPSLQGKLYVDGSCTTHVVRELRRAATALVAREHGHEATWRMRLPVPTPLPQSSQSAEFAALTLVQRYLNGDDVAVDLASDCANVVRACGSAAGTIVARGKALYSGLVRQVMCDPRWSRLVRVRKVPAHVRPESLPEGPERDDAIGNDLADAEAKRARGAHPQPPPWSRSRWTPTSRGRDSLYAPLHLCRRCSHLCHPKGWLGGRRCGSARASRGREGTNGPMLLASGAARSVGSSPPNPTLARLRPIPAALAPSRRWKLTESWRWGILWRARKDNFLSFSARDVARLHRAALMDLPRGAAAFHPGLELRP